MPRLTSLINKIGRKLFFASKQQSWYLNPALWSQACTYTPQSCCNYPKHQTHHEDNYVEYGEGLSAIENYVSSALSTGVGIQQESNR